MTGSESVAVTEFEFVAVTDCVAVREINFGVGQLQRDFGFGSVKSSSVS